MGGGGGLSFSEYYKELLRKRCFQPPLPPPPQLHFQSPVKAFSAPTFKVAPRSLKKELDNMENFTRSFYVILETMLILKSKYLALQLSKYICDLKYIQLIG